MSSTCIRVLADPIQIRDCKESIHQMNDQLLAISRIYSLAGAPARLKMLYLLRREGEMCPCDLSDVLDISVPGVSQHLRKLKDGGLVKDKKVGQTILYSLKNDMEEVLITLLELSDPKIKMTKT